MKEYRLRVTEKSLLTILNGLEHREDFLKKVYINNCESEESKVYLENLIAECEKISKHLKEIMAK